MDSSKEVGRKTKGGGMKQLTCFAALMYIAGNKQIHEHFNLRIPSTTLHNNPWPPHASVADEFHSGARLPQSNSRSCRSPPDRVAAVFHSFHTQFVSLPQKCQVGFQVYASLDKPIGRVGCHSSRAKSKGGH